MTTVRGGHRGDNRHELSLGLRRRPGDGEGGEPLVRRNVRPDLLDARAGERLHLRHRRHWDPKGGRVLDDSTIGECPVMELYRFGPEGGGTYLGDDTEGGGESCGGEGDDRRELHRNCAKRGGGGC